MSEQATEYFFGNGSDSAIAAPCLHAEAGRVLRESKDGAGSGESTRLPPMWTGFKSRRRRLCGLSFVVGSLSCSERHFSGYSVFPSPYYFLNSKSTRVGRRRAT